MSAEGWQARWLCSGGGGSVLKRTSAVGREVGETMGVGVELGGAAAVEWRRGSVLMNNEGGWLWSEGGGRGCRRRAETCGGSEVAAAAAC